MPRQQFTTCVGTSASRRPKGASRAGRGARRRADLYWARRRLLKAGERLSELEPCRLCELVAREP